MEPLNFQKDPLLLGEDSYKTMVTANQLLKEKFPLLLEGKKLNLYSSLVKSFDFEKTLGSHCFCSISPDKIKEYLPSSYNSKNFRKLREDMKCYSEKEILSRSVRTWTKNEIWPLFILRVISRLYDEDKEILSDLLKSVNYFTDSTHKNKFIPPKTLSKLLTKEQAYFIGCAFGDGGFSTNEYWVIVDGGKKEELIYSQQWLGELSSLINRMYNIEFTDNNPRQRENKVELWVSNTWFERFVNFWFSLPYGKKKNKIEKPKIFKLSKNPEKLYKHFWRGMFDADGHCSNESMKASLSSATSKVLNQCQADFKKLDITSKISKPRNLRIYSKSFAQFGRKIGFSHPRKRRILLKQLAKGPKETQFKGINPEKLIDNKFFDLNYIKNLRVYGIKEDIREIRKELGLTQQELSNKLKLGSSQTFYWEKGCGIQFEPLINLYGLLGVKKKELLKLLSQKNISWGLSGRGLTSNLVNLPIKVTDNVINLAYHLRPYDCEVRLRKTGHSKDTMKKIENTFGIEVKELREEVYYLSSQVLIKFLKNFFSYGPYWKPFDKDELNKLDKKLKVNF